MNEKTTRNSCTARAIQKARKEARRVWGFQGEPGKEVRHPLTNAIVGCVGYGEKLSTPVGIFGETVTTAKEFRGRWFHTRERAHGAHGEASEVWAVRLQDLTPVRLYPL